LSSPEALAFLLLAIAPYNSAMRRSPHVEKVHELLLDWATWTATHPHGLSLLGNMSADWLAVRSDTPAKCLVPTDLPPGKIGRVDQALHDPEIPETHLRTLVVKYLGSPEESREVSRAKHAHALEWLAGRIA
jgi:hypothetical protein